MDETTRSSGMSVRRKRTLTFRKNDFVVIDVGDPITHNTWEHGRYSTYQFKIQTNSIVFTLAESSVRRRYSHFVWLRKQLKKNHESITPPPLPPKTFLCSRFTKNVLSVRIQGLAEFLYKVLEETLYLSDSLLHLFLQTELGPADMTACVLAGSGVNVSDVIVREERQKVSAGRSSCLCDSSLAGLPPAVREAALAQSPLTISTSIQHQRHSPDHSPHDGATCHTNRLSVPVLCVTAPDTSPRSGFLECELKLGHTTSTPVVGILKAHTLPSGVKRNDSLLDVGDVDSGCSMDDDNLDGCTENSLELSLKVQRKRRVTFSEEIIVSPIERVF